MSILLVGGTVVDVIFPQVRRLPAWPDHTEFTPSNLVLLEQAPLVTIGGNAANAAYVAARLGAACHLQTNLGDDAFGGLAKTWLESAGVVLSPARRGGRTAVNVTANNARMQRATFFYPGSAAPQPGALPKAARVTHALVCGWPHPPTPVLVRALRAWRRHGAFTAYDAGPLLEEAPTLATLAPVLAELDLFLSNEHELLTLTGETRLDRAFSSLRRRFPGEIVIKLGPKGCVWSKAASRALRRIPGLKVAAVNTVGAGDTFNGALLARLCNGAPMLAALHAANRAAADVVRSGRGVLGLHARALSRKKR